MSLTLSPVITTVRTGVIWPFVTSTILTSAIANCRVCVATPAVATQVSGDRGRCALSWSGSSLWSSSWSSSSF
jgi:hypothetical protein